MKQGKRWWRAAAWSVGVVALGVLLGLVAHDHQLAWYRPHESSRVTVKLAIYWGLWLLWPFVIWLLLRLWRSGRARRRFDAIAALTCLCICATLAWARFIEPRWLTVKETQVSSTCGVRVALISDLHMGLYVRQSDLERLVERLNGLQIDAVLVAGDWTYEPPRDLKSTFSPLAKLRHPMYSVLGNHDEEKPGPALKPDLLAALSAAGVHPIDGQRVPLGQCELEGLGDLLAHSAERNLAALKTQAPTKPPAQRVVLTHNPDTVSLLEPGYAALLLAGHTHGGQIDVPVFTARLIEQLTEGGFRRGLYERPQARVFVTSGVGTDKLPMRFRVPPTIDVLSL